MIKKYKWLTLSSLVVIGILIVLAIGYHNFMIDQDDQVELRATYNSITIARRWISQHQLPIADNQFVCFTNDPEHRGTFWHACRGTMPEGQIEEFSCDQSHCEPGNIISKLR